MALSENGGVTLSSFQTTASVIIQYIMNWAVPCFVMVTGALLLDNDKEITYKKLFTKYILKIILVILIFSVIFQLIDTILSNQLIDLQTIVAGIKNALFNRSWIHMWYLYMIVAVYLMLPIYRKITARANKKDIFYLLILYTIFLIIVDILNNGIKYSDILINQSNYTTSEVIGLINEVRSPTFYIFVQKVWPLYLFLGYAIHKNILNIKPLASIIMLTAGILSVVILVLLSNSINNITVTMICNVLCSFNSSPIYLFMSLGIFSLLHNLIELKSEIVVKSINKIDNCSFGIYLIHLIPIKIFIAKLKFNPYNYGGLFGVLLFSLAVTFMSFLAVLVYKKVLRFIIKSFRKTEAV